MMDKPLRCVFGFHCWHASGTERIEDAYVGWIPGLKTHIRDYNATTQECCRCDETRLVM